MAISPARLRRELQQAGIANSAIDAVWPRWWSDDAEGSLSATAELTFTVARRLGLSPRALFDGTAQFLWRDDTKFKNLGTQTDKEEAVLASFGVAAGRAALAATANVEALPSLSAEALRTLLLRHAQFVNAAQIISFCWSIGIPVVQLRVFPLTSKRMHAATVRVEDRYAILLAFESRYQSRAAYILAHEIGHILLGHLVQNDALLELSDPLVADATSGGGYDEEEAQADRFALTLLTGQPGPEVLPDTQAYTASSLAAAAMRASLTTRIDPGILALCLGYTTGRWKESFGALKAIPPGQRRVGQEINAVANGQFDWDALSTSAEEYLERLIGRENES